MKIVHSCLCGPVTDGWTYQDNLLPKYHKKMGHDVSVIASQYVWDNNGKIIKTDKSDYVNEDGVHVVRIPSRLNTTIESKIRLYSGLYEKLCDLSPDILFVHGVQCPEISDIVKYVKKHREVTVFVDNHADFSNSAHTWLSKNVLHKILWKHYAKKIEPYVSKFYGVLPARVDFLRDMYGIPKEKIELLVMGADDEMVEKAVRNESRENVRAKHHIERDAFLIVTGGKIDAYKTQTLLLMEAVKNIKDPKVNLIVFGSLSSDIKDKVEALVDSNRIQYIGWIDPNESYDYFAASDLVVFPGRHSVFWEQVAGQGIPLLVKRWNGTEHINYCDNALFIDKDSVEAIQEKLDFILKDNNYEIMKNNAEKAAKHFCYSGIAEKSIESVETP